MSGKDEIEYLDQFAYAEFDSDVQSFLFLLEILFLPNLLEKGKGEYVWLRLNLLPRLTQIFLI